jgi:hypothetical protein
MIGLASLGFSVMSDITSMRDRLRQGESKAADELLPVVYAQLRQLASANMASQAPGQTLQPTAYIVETQADLDLRHPISMFTFMDKEPGGTVEGGWLMYLDQTPGWFTLPGHRDRGYGANVAFADEHVEFKKWQYLGRGAGVVSSIANARDRADWEWVMNASTSPT